MTITRIKSKMLESNVFVLKKDKHCLIVDCGVELDKVKSVVGDSQVDGILLTHGHFDHSAYCNEYANFFQTQIYANINIKKTLTDIKAIYSEESAIIDDFSRFVFIDKDKTLNLGEFEIQCYSSPGHSPCCECYQIGEMLFAGDVLFENGIGSVSLINSNKKDMLATLGKLYDVDFKIVYSGHGNDSRRQTQEKNLTIFKRFLSR